jgi:hypothetical protein
LNLENNNEVIVDIVNSAYICVSNAIAKRGATNCQEWVQKVIIARACKRYWRGIVSALLFYSVSKD